MDSGVGWCLGDAGHVDGGVDSGVGFQLLLCIGGIGGIYSLAFWLRFVLLIGWVLGI